MSKQKQTAKQTETAVVVEPRPLAAHVAAMRAKFAVPNQAKNGDPINDRIAVGHAIHAAIVGGANNVAAIVAKLAAYKLTPARVDAHVKHHTKLKTPRYIVANGKIEINPLAPAWRTANPDGSVKTIKPKS